MSQASTIDWVAVLERFEGDTALFGEVARLFLDDYPKRLCVMQDALSCRDWKTLARVAHSLKGSVSNFAAADAIAAAARLEALAQERECGAAAAAACDTLEREIERLRSELVAAVPSCCDNPYPLGR